MTMWKTKTRCFVWQRKNQKSGRQEEAEHEDEEKEGEEGEEEDMPRVIAQEIRITKSLRRKARKMKQEESGRAAKPRSKEETKRQRLRRKRITGLKERMQKQRKAKTSRRAPERMQ